MWLKRSKEPISVRVSTYDSELEFTIPHNATGQLLFDLVTKSIGLRETWYFGLQYQDECKLIAWLDLDEKVMRQEVPKQKYDDRNPLRFLLRVQFHPEDVEEEIIQDVTLRYFFNQVLGAIIADEIYCPPETCVLLASYALQARFGDYIISQNAVQCDHFLPARVIDQHNFTSAQWNERINKLWNGLSGLSREDAMREYLKLAQDLEMYGVCYFETKNKKDTLLWLGIDARGLNVYFPDDKLNPKTAFPWSEIRVVANSARRFVIKPKEGEMFAFILERSRLTRRILSMAKGNHKLFIRRREPDTIEIQQMKSQAAEEREIKNNEQARLRLEIEAREQAEKTRKNCEDKMKLLADEMQARQRNLIEAYEQIRYLEEQLRLIKNAKDDLEQRAAELEKLNAELAQSAQLESTEREKLQEKVREKQEEYERLKLEVAKKDEEARQLENAVEENRSKRFEESFEPKDGGDNNGNHEEESTTDDEEQSQEKELLLANNDESRVREEIQDTAVSKKKHLQQQLKQLVEDLELNVDEHKVTHNDQLHRKNVKSGRDKYKTLRDIRNGNTLRRVEYFENM